MNKAELILTVAEQTGLSKKDVETGLNAVLTAIIDSLVQEEKVQLVGFGSFEIKHRAERLGRNPKTKEVILIPETKVPTFKASKYMKDQLDAAVPTA